MTNWHDRQPKFRQIANFLIQQILLEVWKEGDTLPSIRSVASDMKVNHLTVMKGYQILVSKGFVEKRPGHGMFVVAGAKQQILEAERKHFVEQQIPQIALTLRRLNMPLDELNQYLKLHMKGSQ